MIDQVFNSDVHPMVTPVTCVSLRSCGAAWQSTMKAAMTGIIRAGNPEYFDAMLESARDKENPERQREARASVAGINNYVGSVLRALEQRGGDTFDAIGAAMQISFVLEDHNRLPTPAEIAQLVGDKKAMEGLGIHKPWTEYLETEKEFEARKEKHEADKAEQFRRDAAAGRNKVHITLPLQRRAIVHNGEMKLSTDVPAGFERFFSGTTIDTPKSLDTLNNEIAALNAPADVAAKAERKISGASRNPGA